MNKSFTIVVHNMPGVPLDSEMFANVMAYIHAQPSGELFDVYTSERVGSERCVWLVRVDEMRSTVFVQYHPGEVVRVTEYDK